VLARTHSKLHSLYGRQPLRTDAEPAQFAGTERWRKRGGGWGQDADRTVQLVLRESQNLACLVCSLSLSFGK
jgi:hypothetical protein